MRFSLRFVQYQGEQDELINHAILDFSHFSP